MSEFRKPVSYASQAALVYPETIEQMFTALEQLGLKPVHRDLLAADAANLIEAHSPRTLDVPPAQARLELETVAKTLRRARKALGDIGALGYFKLARGYALEKNGERAGDAEGWPELTRLVDAIMRAETAAARAVKVPTERFRMPQGQREIARARRLNLAHYLADLDAAFERHAGYRPPRSEHTAGRPYPWFLFCKLAAAPLGAPQSNEGFRRLFRLAVKVAGRNDEGRP